MLVPQTDRSNFIAAIQEYRSADVGHPAVPQLPAGLPLSDAENAIDFTLKPDFSQVEADTAQISANERFALFFPEKRPFFLEGVDLFSTPLQAVYTRTITSPGAGGRLTGKASGVRYTVLVADDRGGGSVILADQWTGQRLRGHAAVAQWNHSTTHFDAFGLSRPASA